mmetsp:Transcript_8162/g.20534  ORF Transcript_8162/g.20534 Transcript_8162/m.20534 type:complete len:111 (-) Transcript_8162:2380-2712(-)
MPPQQVTQKRLLVGGLSGGSGSRQAEFRNMRVKSGAGELGTLSSHVPQKPSAFPFTSKLTAPSNIFAMSVAEDGTQAEISWLKDVASANILEKLVTPVTSQHEMSPLNVA